jgi:hypothetical protein
VAIVLDRSTITTLQAKTRIARVAGDEDDAGWLSVAGEALEDALRRIQSKKDWSWLLVVHADITLITDQSEYLLTAAFRKPYSVRMKSHRLHFVPQWYYDHINPGNTGTAGRYNPAFYSMFNASASGKIALLPSIGTVDAADNKLYVRYWRPIEIGDNGTALDLPTTLERCAINLGKGYILSERGNDEARANKFLALGEQLLDAAALDDVKLPDAPDIMMPEPLGPSDWQPNSLAVLLGGTDGGWW